MSNDVEEAAERILGLRPNVENGLIYLYSQDAYTVARAYLDLARREREMREALDEIKNLNPAKFDGFPADWSEQIEACPECQRYKNHPIQNGICDTHRKPLWARERHDAHEPARLYYKAMRIARAALSKDQP